MQRKNVPSDPDATMAGGLPEDADSTLLRKPKTPPEAFDPDATYVPAKASPVDSPVDVPVDVPIDLSIDMPLDVPIDAEGTLLRAMPASSDDEATQLRPPPRPAAPPPPARTAAPADDEATQLRPPPRPVAPPPVRTAAPSDDEATQLRPPPRPAAPPPPVRPAAPSDDEATQLRPPLRPAAPPPSAQPASAPPAPREAAPTGLARFKDHADAEGTVMMRRPMPNLDPEATAYIPTPGRRRGAAAAPPSTSTPPVQAAPVPPPPPPRPVAAAPAATAAAAPAPAAPAPVSVPPAAAAPAVRSVDPAEAQLESLVGLNPLIAAANRLLSAVPQIRGSLKHPNPASLRDELLARVGQFNTAAAAKGYPERTVATARYALCALVDDAALHTPWGSAARWDENGLLRSVEGESLSAAGEKFFNILAELEESPAANIEIIEFFAVCIALGYEGRFASAPGGRVQMEPIWAKLQGLIRERRGGVVKELSLRWEGLDVPLRRRSPWFGAWVSACVCAAVLVSVYLGLRIALATSSEPAARALAALRADVKGPAAAKGNQPLLARLKTYLAKELTSGQVVLQEDGMRSVVTISGDELFASGSDTIEERYVPTVLRIAQALDKVPGSIIIAGHTDDKPIRSARFPSNWDLSRERAVMVMRLMAGELADPGRLRAEGLADSEPVAPNDSAANRARNRRVTAILRVAP